ncbi:NUDIX hydrolase [Streptococcus zalophi]|uniref:NUDIX hydrolase n=1 Tax=Streptococcus zalophi TaxID=640031 RepID=A0A934P9S2_9STRE|nr:NUDIX hydrolase [Streptococcus zalophi]MBJ8349673.1 NUDIX hydrolase [Streptococcus zalophi]MCR8967978.1 NUDIX hydrolase [Streptococcus zalophi]
MTNPVFGTKEENIDYVARYGVYAVIADSEKEKIILVQAPNGAWFLPGGEIEAGEDHFRALKRELMEELGFEATIGNFFGQADEYFYSSHRQTHYYNPAYLYDVINYEKVSQPLEDFNNLKWFSIKEAILKLKRGSHRWGIEQWQKKYKIEH